MPGNLSGAAIDEPTDTVDVVTKIGKRRREQAPQIQRAAIGMARCNVHIDLELEVS